MLPESGVKFPKWATPLLILLIGGACGKLIGVYDNSIAFEQRISVLERNDITQAGDIKELRETVNANGNRITATEQGYRKYLLTGVEKLDELLRISQSKEKKK